LQESDGVFMLTFLDALGEHQIWARWIADGVTEWLADHGIPSLQGFLQERYPLKVDQLVNAVGTDRRDQPLNLPLRVV
jgi:hypothetical protein